MSTNQQIIDRARQHRLNDADEITWQDTELFAHLVHGLRLLQYRRPDLYYGIDVTVLDTLVVGDAFPLDPFLEHAIEDYVSARAHFKDDEYAVQGAASAFYALFKEALA